MDRHRLLYGPIGRPVAVGIGLGLVVGWVIATAAIAFVSGELAPLTPMFGMFVGMPTGGVVGALVGVVAPRLARADDARRACDERG